MATIVVRYKTKPEAGEENVVVEDEGETTVSLADLPAVQRFQAGIVERCEEQPVAMGATIVGAHRFLSRQPT